MMPLSTFNLFIAVVVLLIIYSLIDYRNKLYGNIAAAILASIIGALLAILVFIGAVQTDAGSSVSDMSTAGILLLVSVVIAVYTFFMIMEAKEEYESAQEQL